MSEQSKAPGGDDAGDGASATSGRGDDAQGPGTTDRGDGSTDRTDGSIDRGDGSTPPTEPRDGSAGAQVVGLDSTDAEAVLGAVASDTARSVLDALHEEPSTVSGIADRVDCSLQTVQYHLGNLSDADLVETRGTTTSEKGREMVVYGPAQQPVVVYAGDEDDGDDIRSMLTRLVSGVAFLGLLSLLVQELFGRERGPAAGTTGDTAVSLSAEAADSAGVAGGVEPGLLFFAGGLVVLAAYLAVWYLRRRGTLDGLRPTA